MDNARFVTRAFHDAEYADDAPRRKSHVTVVEALGALKSSELAAHLAERRSEFDQYLADAGALLFRGFPIDSVGRAEDIITSQGIQLDADYLGGASPRSSLTRGLFTSTEAPPRYIISFHTEMCYLRQRPSRILFYCDIEPEKFGETPLFDCAEIYSRLDDELCQRIDEQGMIYERHFQKNPSRINVYKTWSDAFHTDDKAEVEAACAAQGMQFQWEEGDRLVTRASMPGAINHPRSGKRCISLTLYNEYAASCDIQRFGHRFNPLVRVGLSMFSRFMFGRKRIFMRTLWGDGSPITQAQTRKLIDAAWKSATVFRWQRGDLLILDNIRTGHGRLNVEGPRRIAAGLGDLYSVDQQTAIAA